MEQRAYKVFIIEDSEQDRELLEKSLMSYNLFQIVGCLPGGSGVLALIQRLHPDLLFVDVELPGLPGYELVNRLHEQVTWNMKVVFYTAYPQYMLEAIRSAAFDFLLKPFEMKELDLIVNRFIQSKIEKKEEVNTMLVVYAGWKMKLVKMLFPSSCRRGRFVYCVFQKSDILNLMLHAGAGKSFYSFRNCWPCVLPSMP